MLNSSKAAISVATRDNVPSRKLRFDPRDSSSATHERVAKTPRLGLAETFDPADFNAPLAVIPMLKRPDRRNTASKWSIFAYFMEGFALYGASYGSCGALLDAAVTSRAEPGPVEVGTPRPNGSSPRQPRRFIAIIASNSGLSRSKPENDADRHGRGAEALPANTGLAGFASRSSFDADRLIHRNWLTNSRLAVASRWAHWRRERAIKRAVSGLAKFDDQTLRDIGIPHRSQIEQVVRYCRDC